MAAVIDIYRVRRMIEVQALRTAFPQHPAVARMAAAVATAQDCVAAQDWLAVGNANMEFHAAIVDLADSPRLNELFTKLATELPWLPAFLRWKPFPVWHRQSRL